MTKPPSNPSFATLLQRFFVDHLHQQRAVSPSTISAYRDTFRLLLRFAEVHIGKTPARITLADLDATFLLAFLDHLEHERHNTPRSRNARLAALRCFLKYAAHYDISVLHIIQQSLAIPIKRFEKPMLGFLSQEEMQAVLDAPESASWIGQRDHALLTLLYNTGAWSSSARLVSTSMVKGAKTEPSRCGVLRPNSCGHGNGVSPLQKIPVICSPTVPELR